MNKKKIKLISILAATAIILTLVICLYAFSAAKAKNNQNGADESQTTLPDDTKEYTPPVYESPDKNGGENEETTDLGENETDPPAEKSLEYLSNGNGTCTVTGIGNVTDTCIIIPEKSPSGEVVTNIGDKAFFGNNVINAVQIPSTVTHIGDMAFGGCTSLIYISVNTENTCFVDKGGILYSADGKNLIHYPALKGNSTLEISSDVTAISAMAFYGCDSLKYIDYNGDVSAWAAINIGEMNYSLFSISVRCNETE